MKWVTLTQGFKLQKENFYYGYTRHLPRLRLRSHLIELSGMSALWLHEIHPRYWTSDADKMFGGWEISSFS